MSDRRHGGFLRHRPQRLDTVPSIAGDPNSNCTRASPVIGSSIMDRWLEAALDYTSRWLEFQMRMSRQPGCIIAVAHRGRIVLEQAFGHADLSTGARLTPRH